MAGEQKDCVVTLKQYSVKIWSEKPIGGMIKWIFAITFISILTLPLASHLTNTEPATWNIREYRNLTDFPDLKTLAWRDIPANLDKYFRDRLGFRSQFVANYIYLWERVMEAPVALYQTGKNGEMFMTYIASTFLPFLGLTPFTERQLLELRFAYAGTQAFFEMRDIPYLLMMVPDKPTLYPEWLPFWSEWKRGTPRYEQLQSALQDTRINFLDMLPIMQAEKQKRRLYDVWYDICHWNGNALSLAYEVMVERIGKDFPGMLTPCKAGDAYYLSDKNMSMPQYGKETVPLIGIPNIEKFEDITEIAFFKNRQPYAQPIMALKNRAAQNGFLWLISDSYFRETHNYKPAFPIDISPLANYFQFYLSSHWVEFSPDFANAVFQERKPTFVVEEFVERMLGASGRYQNPYLRTLADILLDVPTIALPERIFSQQSGERERERELPLPTIRSDKSGLFAISGRISASENGMAKLVVRYKEKNSDPRKEAIFTAPINQGTNIFHIHSFIPPEIDAAPTLILQGCGNLELLPLPVEILAYKAKKSCKTNQ